MAMSKTKERILYGEMIVGAVLIILGIFHVSEWLDNLVVRSGSIGLVCGSTITLYLDRQKAWDRKFKDAEHIK